MFQAFFNTCNFYIFPFFTPGKQPYFEISEMTTHTTEEVYTESSLKPKQVTRTIGHTAHA